MSTTYDFGSSTRVEESQLLAQHSSTESAESSLDSPEREHPIEETSNRAHVGLLTDVDEKSALALVEPRGSGGRLNPRRGGDASAIFSGILSVASWVASELAWIGRDYVRRSRPFDPRDRSSFPIGMTREQLMLRNIELERVSRTDALTGLPNRRHLDEQLRGNFAALHRRNQPFSVLLLDIDNFKWVNDSYGHLAGDDVICEFTRRLSGVLRADDFAGRWGGEEFLLVLPNTEWPAALALADRIRSTVADSPIVLPGGTFFVTVSGGLATARQASESPAQLVRRADEALYRAKRSGRNQIASDWW